MSRSSNPAWRSRIAAHKPENPAPMMPIRKLPGLLTCRPSCHKVPVCRSAEAVLRLISYRRESQRRTLPSTQERILKPADCNFADPLLAQRNDFAPTNRELSLLLRKSMGRDIDSFGLLELELARMVFAQVALMAGAALAGDSELFAGADRLWRDMQRRIGEQDRRLAKRFLKVLAEDGEYAEAERNLLVRLAEALDEQLMAEAA